MISEYEVRNSCQGNVCVGEIYNAPLEKYQENLESGNFVIQHIRIQNSFSSMHTRGGFIFFKLSRFVSTCNKVFLLFFISGMYPQIGDLFETPSDYTRGSWVRSMLPPGIYFIFEKCN